MSMANCTSPYSHTSDPVFYVTNVVMMPIIFGVGVVGNFLTIVILNRSYMRTTSPIYVYLTALAVCDILTLSLMMPKALRDMASLRPQVGYSRQMTIFITLNYGFSNIFKHASSWIVVFVAVVRYVVVSDPTQTRRWTQISASRIIVFVIVLFCLILDFPRFFELEVMEMKGHCFEKLVLWDWRYTQLGRDQLFLTIYPWVAIAVFFVLPFFLILLLNTLLMIRIRIWRVIRHHLSVAPSTRNADMQINVMLIAIICTFFLLELPDAIAHVLLGVGAEAMRYNKQYNDFILIANCLSLLHSSINFILYTIFSSDFRKTFRRTFCCVCLTGDEYYEPVTCKDFFTGSWSKMSPRARPASTSGSSVGTGRSNMTTRVVNQGERQTNVPMTLGAGGWV